MLLVDHDQPEPVNRREDRRARPDDDPRLAARDPHALVAPFRIGEPGVEDRDAVAEPRAHPADRLRRQRDLRHEQDRPEPPLEHCSAGLEVDLGLPGSGRPVEQEGTARAGVDRGDDAVGRHSLLRQQLVRLGLAAEGLPLGRWRLLLAPLRQLRRDQRERAGRRRAVVRRRSRARARRAPAGPARPPGRSARGRRLPASCPRGRPRLPAPGADRTASSRSPPAPLPLRPRT